jgi:hypothetical protein
MATVQDDKLFLQETGTRLRRNITPVPQIAMQMVQHGLDAVMEESNCRNRVYKLIQPDLGGETARIGRAKPKAEALCACLPFGLCLARD